MSRSVRNILLVALAVVSFFGLRSLFYKKVEVPDINTNVSQRLSGEEALDYAGLVELLEASYGEVELRMGMISDSAELDGALVILLNQSYVNLEEGYEVGDYLLAGADVVVISTSLGCHLTDSVYTSIKVSDEQGGTILVGGTEYAIEQLDLQQMSDDYRTRLHHFQHLPSTWPADRYLTLQTKEMSRDSMGKRIGTSVMDTFFLKMPHSKGSLAIHAMPLLYYNYHVASDFYYDHYLYTLGNYDPSSVYVVRNSFGNMQVSNPLRYAMASRGVRWGIYIVLLGTFFWLWNGRRREAAIPLVTPVENTTLDFVSTVARLYAKSDNQGKLVDKMIENFYRHNEERYRIHRLDEQYWQRLATVTMVSKELLDQIAGYCKVHADQTKTLAGSYQRIHMLLTKYYSTAK